MFEEPVMSADAVITTGVRRGATVLSCSGEVDITSVAALRAKVDESLASRPPALVIDLLEVRFFGSSGISALVAAQEHANRVGVPLGVVAAGRPVLRPLEATTVDRVLTMFTSVDAAVAAMLPADEDREASGTPRGETA
ncbi:MAG TPA: STAS domain-containing protein [Umezawaea sp.]|nr:STAS domain-containing protein [Umezawaea sp.]